MKKLIFSISFVLLFVFAGMAQYSEATLSFRYDHYTSLIQLQWGTYIELITG